MPGPRTLRSCSGSTNSTTYYDAPRTIPSCSATAARAGKSHSGCRPPRMPGCLCSGGVRAVVARGRRVRGAGLGRTHRIRRGRFALIYLLSALAGDVASAWWDPTRVAAGASGAIFGVYGALLAFFMVRRTEIPARTLKVVGKGAALLCAYALLFGAVAPFVDNAAHIGGLIAGALSAALLARPLDPAARARPQPARVVAMAVGGCLLLAFVASGVEAPRLSDSQ